MGGTGSVVTLGRVSDRVVTARGTRSGRRSSASISVQSKENSNQGVGRQVSMFRITKFFILGQRWETNEVFFRKQKRVGMGVVNGDWREKGQTKRIK